jgi:mitotic-spindle organizing protein 1
MASGAGGDEGAVVVDAATRKGVCGRSCIGESGVVDVRATMGRAACAALLDLAALLNTGVTEESLDAILRLCEAGVNADAIATVVRELRTQAAATEAKEAEMRGDARSSAPSSGRGLPPRE